MKVIIIINRLWLPLSIW